MAYTVDQLIQEAGKLPPIPQTAQKALALLRKPETSAVDLAAVLAVDQVLSGQLLRWANSAFYGMENRIATVQQAIVVLGFNALQELIYASSVAGYLNKSLPGYELKRGELWRHSVGMALAAKQIAKTRGQTDPEEAYFAALLCDMGKLAFEKLLRETDTDLPGWDERSFLEMERAYFGVDHAMLGAEMARRWQLPGPLVAAIAHHHQPEAAQDHPALAATVHVADVVMMMLGVGIGKDGLRYALDPAALQRLRLNDADILFLLERTTDQLKAAEKFIGFGLEQG